MAALRHPTIIDHRRMSVTGEEFNPEDLGDVKPKITYPKTDEQRRRLREAVKDIFLFRSLDSEQMSDVLDGMFERKVIAGETVIKQGDDGDNFYIIESGVYDIFVGDEKYGVYDNIGSFGELALMYSQKRVATIVATTDGSLWTMNRSTFRQLVANRAYQKRKRYEAFIENVPMLKFLDHYERANIADVLTSKTFHAGEMIVKQGDVADCMYFVEKGEVKIMAQHPDKVCCASCCEPEVEISTVKVGGFFGELALIKHKPRAASAYAVGNVRCAVLEVKAFERIMGPCMDVMTRNVEEYNKQHIFDDEESSGSTPPSKELQQSSTIDKPQDAPPTSVPFAEQS